MDVMGILLTCRARVAVNGCTGTLGDEVLPGRFFVWFDKPDGRRRGPRGEYETPDEYTRSASFDRGDIQWL